jgi:hypothetical protein
MRSSSELPSPSPPAEKAAAREDQAGKASTGDGSGDTTDGDRRIVVSLKAAIAAQDKLSDGLTRASMNVEIVCGLIGLTEIESTKK